MATAHGEDVTLGELRAEAAARELSGEESSSATQADLLRAVLDRKLWAAEARREGLDQDADYLLARRRLEEALLAKSQISALTNAVAPPTDAEISNFLATRPNAFASRTVFTIDQIDLPIRSTAAALAPVKQAKSLDQIESMMVKYNLVGQRSRTEWNSMFMSDKLVGELDKLDEKQIFFHRNGGTLIVGRILSRAKVPLGYNERRAVVRQAMTQRKVQAVLAARLAKLREGAGIQVQAAYTPPSSETSVAPARRER